MANLQSFNSLDDFPIAEIVFKGLSRIRVLDV